MSLRKSWSASVETSRTLSSSRAASFASSALGCRVDDLDLQLLERPVDVFELGGLELELVERERDLLGADASGGLRRLEQVSRLLRLEDVCCRVPSVAVAAMSPSLAMPEDAMRGAAPP